MVEPQRAITTTPSSLALVPEPHSEQERLALFQELTPTQQRVLLLSVAGETKQLTASRCGVAVETLDAWLYPSHPRHSPAFRTLWYSRSVASQVEYLEKTLELHGPRNLERANKVASLLDTEDLGKLKERTLGIAATMALKLATAPIDAKYRKQKQDDTSEGDVIEFYQRLTVKRAPSNENQSP